MSGRIGNEATRCCTSRSAPGSGKAHSGKLSSTPNVCSSLNASCLQLRRWANVFLIAPLSANTLAEIANGLCPNLVVSQQPHTAAHTPIIHRAAVDHFSLYLPVPIRAAWCERGTSTSLS